MRADTQRAVGAGLVAPSDIAEMAGVSRAAVSNWRKRNEDFPDRVGGSPAKPLFDRQTVTAWLRGRGYEVAQDRGEQVLWAALNEFRGALDPQQIAELALSFACARKLSEHSAGATSPWQLIRSRVDTDGVEALREVATQMADEDPRWATLADPPTAGLTDTPQIVGRVLEVLDDIAPDELGPVLDDILGRLATAQIRSGGEHGLVGSRVSRLLANMATGAAGVLYDPACGIASALILARNMDVPITRIVGHDIDTASVRIAQQRCLLHDIEAEFATGDVLAQDPDPDLRADVILLEPPFRHDWTHSRNLADPRWAFGIAPSSSSEMAWLQHCISHLAPNPGSGERPWSEGKAFAVTSMGALSSDREEPIRAELVRQGCVEAICSLPSKMLPHTSIPLALWVLCRPGQAEPGVLFVDASNTDAPEDHAFDWLFRFIGEYPEEDADPPFAFGDPEVILHGKADLSPRLWIELSGPNPSDIRARFRDGTAELTHELAALATTDAATTQAAAPFLWVRVFSIDDLVRSGVLKVRPGRHRVSKEEREARPGYVVTAADVRSGQLISAPDSEVPPSVEPVAEIELTQPGDVLVTTVRGIHTVVDQVGGRVLAPGVSRIRVTQPEECQPAFLAAVLPGAWNGRFITGSSLPRVDLMNLEVPLVPVDDQNRLTEAASQLDQLAQRAEKLATAARSTQTALLERLRHDVDLE